MSKHTPGPWISNGHGVHGKDNAWVASLRAESYQQKEIDGRLIAAAPELLSALNHALAALDDAMKNHTHWIYADAQNEALQAIAKAEGKTP